MPAKQITTAKNAVEKSPSETLEVAGDKNTKKNSVELLDQKGFDYLQNVLIFNAIAKKYGCPTEDLVVDSAQIIKNYLSENNFYMDEFYKQQLYKSTNMVGAIAGPTYNLEDPDFSRTPMMDFLVNAMKSRILTSCDEYTKLAIEFRQDYDNADRKKELHQILVRKQEDIKEAENEKRLKEEQKKIAANLAVVSEVKNRQSELVSVDDKIFVDSRFVKSKFSKNYPDDQMLFLNKYWKYRSLLENYLSYVSQHENAPSERQAKKSLDLAYDLYLPYFYSEGGKRQSYDFPINGITFKNSDDLEPNVKEWQCYVTPPDPQTGIQPLCTIFWERRNLDGDKYVAQIPVFGNGSGPERYVGDQLSISGENVFLSTAGVLGARNKLGFESILNRVIFENVRFDISIEDAIRYDKKKRKWHWN